MVIKKISQVSEAIKIIHEVDNIELGRVFLYFIKNDLHVPPYGLVEDLFVVESARGQGIATELLKQVIIEAKARGCYKLLATSRTERSELHSWYERLGFKLHGVEFRLDL